MLRNTKEMRGFEIDAIDGTIGRVEGFLFEERAWIIRYLATTTGSWPFGKRLLIATEALEDPDRERRMFPVTLTKDQVKSCAEIDWKNPVSRRLESELHEMFEWFPYWNYTDRKSVSAIGNRPNYSLAEERFNDSFLRRGRELINLGIMTSDGELGHTEELIIDDEDCSVRHIDYLLKYARTINKSIRLLEV